MPTFPFYSTPLTISIPILRRRFFFFNLVLIVTGDEEEEQQLLSQHLGKEFEIKTLGKLKYFLGIEVAHSKMGIFISQQKYITDLLKETGRTACKPASTPIDPNLKLGNAEEDTAVVNCG